MLNEVMLMGNVGQDAQLRKTNSGKSVVNISLAVQRRGNRAPVWMKATLWNELAEFVASRVGKGSYIMVEGELGTNSWQDQDGRQRTEIIIEARRVEVISFKTPQTPERFDEAGDAREEVEEVHLAQPEPQAEQLPEEPAIAPIMEPDVKPARKRASRKHAAQEISAAL
jgi:single-strand DNA-binding protein